MRPSAMRGGQFQSLLEDVRVQAPHVGTDAAMSLSSPLSQHFLFGDVTTV
jgi:hypothetical protein